MQALLGLLLTPAIVSLIVSLWAGRVFEERRARRDHITKLFEAAREDVRRAIDVGIDYFSTPPADRLALQEVKVIAADRELRAGIPLLIYNVHLTPSNCVRNEVNDGFVDLLVELTGDNFQASEGKVSKEHITRLVYAGANMRTALAKLRDEELRERSEEDFVLRILARLRSSVGSKWAQLRSRERVQKE